MGIAWGFDRSSTKREHPDLVQEATAAMERIRDRDGDGELAARIAAGDEVALVEAYDRHGDAIYGSLVRFLRDPESAAEIVQETFLALWQRAETFDRDAGSLLGWLMRIARNRAIDRLRAAARRPRLVMPVSAADPAGSPWRGTPVDPGEHGAGAGATSSDDVDAPEAAALRRWMQAVVRTSVATLPATERDVLVLAYDNELTQAEIADRLDLPIGTVKSRTRRALARLREALSIVPDLVEEATGNGLVGVVPKAVPRAVPQAFRARGEEDVP